ncbi:MAG: hypothetical protein JWO19_306 [Bryobacterales bacterium]|nr:hypothetical protein [Bryobacterales bacterium]
MGWAKAETLDRIAVSVGQDVITESQVLLDLRVAAFLEHKPVDLSGAAKRQSAQRLVDQLLILREAVDSHVTLPATEAAAGLVAPYAAETGYKTDLVRYGISVQDLAAHLLAGLRTLTFTDLRFRPDVQVSPADVRNYYDGLARQPGSAAAPLPSFEESREQIEKLLLEQRVLEALDKWLATVRNAARIRYRDKAFE